MRKRKRCLLYYYYLLVFIIHYIRQEWGRRSTASFLSFSFFLYHRLQSFFFFLEVLLLQTKTLCFFFFFVCVCVCFGKSQRRVRTDTLKKKSVFFFLISCFPSTKLFKQERKKRKRIKSWSCFFSPLSKRARIALVHIFSVFKHTCWESQNWSILFFFFLELLAYYLQQKTKKKKEK